MFRRNLSLPVRYLCATIALQTCCSPQPSSAVPPPPQRVGQFKIAPRNQATRTAADPQFSVGLQLADRQDVIKVTRAAEHIARQDYHPALVMLQALLNGSENVAKAADKTQRNLLHNIRFEAEQMIGKLPSEALNTYELLAGGDARRQLDAAIEQQNLAALTAVSSSYLHTQAGYEATLLLAFGYRDQGLSLDAAWCIDRALTSRAHAQSATASLALHAAIAWYSAGDPQRTLEKLRVMQRAVEGKKIHVAGKHVALFRDDATALPWLAQLLGESPVPAHTTTNSHSPPSVQNVAEAIEKTHWEDRTSLLDVDAAGLPFQTRGALNVKRQVNDVEKTLVRQNRSAVALTVPQIAGSTLVLRTPDKLQARQVTTGEILWEQRYSRPFEQVLTGDVKPLPGDRGSILDPMLQDRIFTNATYNQITIGDGRVFCISDHGFAGQTTTINRFPFPSPSTKSHPLTTKKFSHLNAISLATGKLLWRVGDEADNRDANFPGHYFLGAPLLLAGQLYCLAEVQREIHLIVLNPATGEIQWSRALHGCGLSVEQSPFRGHSGLTPHYANGQLICPGAGTVVAVDCATRQLVWTHRYNEAAGNASQLRNQRIMLARIAAMQGKPAPRPAQPGNWQDTDVLAFEKHVLLAPRDADELFCLDSETGSLLWKQSREDGLFLVRVDAQQVLIVGAKSVRLMDLHAGKSKWPTPVKIPPPSGSGLLANKKYHLPLSTRAMAVIDLTTGHLETHAIDSDVPLGNLIWQGGHLVSQRADSIQVHVIADARELSDSVD